MKKIMLVFGTRPEAIKKIIKPIQPIKPSPPTKNKPKNSSIKKPSK